MTRNNIIEAINSSNYQAVLAIYKLHKIDSKFDAYFNQVSEPNPTDQHFKMLLSKVKDILRKLDQNGCFTTEGETPELTKNVNHSRPVTLPPILVEKLDFKKTTTARERPRILSNPLINYEELPDNLKLLYDENGKLNSEMKSLHAAMRVEKEDVKRKELLDKICPMEETIESNWETIDNWYKKNKEDIDSAPLTPAEISNKIASAKKYIDRYYESKKPRIIAEYNNRIEFLKSINIEYTAAKLRRNESQVK